MNNNQAKRLTVSVFNLINELALNNNLRTKNLEAIVSDNEFLSKNKFSSATYPDLKITLSPEEIEELKKSERLSDIGIINHNSDFGTWTPLEKLLYSVLWKNRDLGKEKHIVEGIISTLQNDEVSSKTKGLVFYQFGKHLADRQEPIIDQHTVRAFLLFQYNGANDDIEILKIRQKSTINKNDLSILNDYKKWLDSIVSGDSGIQFQIDKVLYSLGKTIKLSKPNNT